VQSEEHRTRKCALRRGHRAKQSKRQPARPADERRVVPENADETVRERDAGDAIGAPGVQIAIDHRAIAHRVARRIEDDLRKFPGIAKPEVESLSRDRMKRLRGVAENDAAGAGRLARKLHRKRKRAPLADLREGTAASREAPRELGQKRPVIFGLQRFRARRPA
jgi:hypothetical protein